MRPNLLLTAAAIAALAVVSGCNKPANNASNAANTASTDQSTTGTASNENTSTPATSSRQANANETNGQPSGQPEVTDVGFATNATLGDLYEIKAAEVALQRSQSNAVKKFAQDMLDAHGKTMADLKGAMPPDGAGRLPTNLDGDHLAMIQNLQNVSADDFDRSYLAQQKQAHEEAASLFRSYAKTGEDTPLRHFAQDTLPTIEKHLDHVASLSSHNRLASTTRKSKAHVTNASY